MQIMGKKLLYLTFDCEVYSKNKELYKDFYHPTLAIAEFFKKEKIPITLFVSLSKKFPSIKDYYIVLDSLLKKLRKNKYVSVQLHLHFYDLPVNRIRSKSDIMKDYSMNELKKIFKWACAFLKKYGFNPVIFRPAGYITGKSEEYYNLLKEFNLMSSNLKEYPTEKIKTFPISTFKSHNRYLKSNKSIITPEIIPAKKVHKEFQKNPDNLLVSNFHSFSVYSSSVLSWHPCSIIKVLRKIKDKFLGLFNVKNYNESYEWKQMKKFIKKYKNQYDFKNFK